MRARPRAARLGFGLAACCCSTARMMLETAQPDAVAEGAAQPAPARRAAADPQRLAPRAVSAGSRRRASAPAPRPTATWSTARCTRRQTDLDRLDLAACTSDVEHRGALARCLRDRPGQPRTAVAGRGQHPVRVEAVDVPAVLDHAAAATLAAGRSSRHCPHGASQPPAQPRSRRAIVVRSSRTSRLDANHPRARGWVTRYGRGGRGSPRPGRPVRRRAGSRPRPGSARAPGRPRPRSPARCAVSSAPASRRPPALADREQRADQRAHHRVAERVGDDRAA